MLGSGASRNKARMHTGTAHAARDITNNLGEARANGLICPTDYRARLVLAHALHAASACCAKRAFTGVSCAARAVVRRRQRSRAARQISEPVGATCQQPVP